MRRVPMPARSKPLTARTPLAPGKGPARAELGRSEPLKTVSAKRAAENRQRRRMADALWPERPRCSVPWCPRMADDLHEILSRGRCGSITDPGNVAPLCRGHHDEVTFTPESELGWAYELGLLRHSWRGTA